MSAWTNFQVWWRGLVAAAIAGGANGVITGFAAVGIDPQHFNLAGRTALDAGDRGSERDDVRHHWRGGVFEAVADAARAVIRGSCLVTRDSLDPRSARAGSAGHTRCKLFD